MTSTGKLFFAAEGHSTGTSDGASDFQVGSVGGDGSDASIIYTDTIEAGTSNYYGVGVDPLNDLYFAFKFADGANASQNYPIIISGRLDGGAGSPNQGTQLSTLHIFPGSTGGQSGDFSVFANGGFAIDPIHHMIYLGLVDNDGDAHSGIYQVSYTPSTGALTYGSLLIPASPGHVQDAESIFVDASTQTLYYADSVYGGPNGAQAQNNVYDNYNNGIYKVNISNPASIPAPTELTDDSVFDPNKDNSNPVGNINSVTVNTAKGLVYFTTQNTSYIGNNETNASATNSENALWVVSTSGGAATKLATLTDLPAQNGLTYDPVGNQLYDSDLTTGKVIQFTLSSNGAAITATNPNFFTLDSNNPNGASNENQLTYVDAPVIAGFTGTSTRAVQGAPSGTAVLSAAPTLVEANQGLGDFASASVQITDAQSGDVLATSTTGTSIGASYNTSTHTLTLTGADTAAHYAQVLGALTYQDTGTDASTGAHPVRNLSFSVSNGAAASTATSSITIDRAPTGAADSYTVATGSSLTTTAGNGVLHNDTDLDGDTLTATAGTAGTNSPTPTLNADGSFTEGLSAGYSVAHFTYTASDGSAASAPVAVTIDFTQYDPKPVNDLGNVAANATLTVNAANGLISNDVDPADSGTGHLSLVVVSNATSGTGAIGTALVGRFGNLTLQADGSYSYVAGATSTERSALAALPNGTTGSDVFTYTETHTGGGTGTATLTITVGDNPPVTATHAVSVLAGATAASTTPIDTDPDGDTLTVTAVAGGTVGTPLAGTYGSITINSNDTYSYTADAPTNPAITGAATGSHPVDSFSYTVNDGKGGTATETLNLSIDRPPVVVGQSHTVLASAAFTKAAAAGALAGDSDPDGDSLAVASVTPGGGSTAAVVSSGTTTVSGSYGDLAIGADGHYSYTAGATVAEQQALAAVQGSHPTDSFALAVSDGGGATASQALAFTIERAPAAPSDTDSAANAVAEGAAVGTTVGVTAASNDPDGDGVAYSLTSDGSNGGFTVNAASGVVTVANASKIDFASSGAGHSYAVTVQASDGTLTSSQSFTIAVSDVAPTIAGAQTGQTTDDKTSLSPFTQVVIAEPASATQQETVHVTLSSAANGVFSAASLTASGFVADGSVPGQYDFIGTAAQDTTAINQLVFAPTNNQAAPGSTVTTTFSITVGDGTASASDTSTTVIATSVNDAPSITGAVAGQTVNDNAAAHPFSAIAITDPDTPAQTQTVSLTLNHPTYGALSNLGGGSYNAATGVYSFSGTAVAATTALQGLVFTPTANQIAPGTTETAGFTLTTNDGVAATVSDATTTLVITSVNDAPTITGAAAGQTVFDNAAAHPFSAVAIGDVDNPAQTQTVSVTLDHPTYGTLSNLGAGAYNATTGVYSFTGTAAAATTALQGLVFTPTVNQIAPGTTETAGFTLTTNDGVAATVSNTATTLVITSVNDAPTITGAVAGQTVNDNATTHPFSAITIGDVDTPAQMQTVSVTLDHPTYGALSNLGGGAYNAATGVYSFSGAAAAATTALRGLVFTPVSNQITPGTTETAGFTVTANDGVASTVSDASTSVVITSVNDAPTITGAAAGQTVNDNATAHPFSAVAIGDVDNPAQTQTVSITLDHPADGALSNLGGGAYNATTGVYSFSGTAAAATTALQGLVFTPTDNQIAPGTTETVGFTVATNDGMASTVSDAATSVVITSVNDAPTITGAAAGQTVNDNAAAHPFSAVAIGDVDTPAQTQTVSVTLNHPTYGALSNLGGGTYNATTGVYNLSGTAASATTALRALIFTPVANQIAPGTTETAAFTIATNDGVASTVSDATTTLVIASVNDAPMITGAVAGQTVNDNVTIDPFSGVTIGDVDTPAQTQAVTVTLSLPTAGALSNLGAGSYNATTGVYSFSGTAAAATTALHGLVFTPTPNQIPYGGSQTEGFTIASNDGFAQTSNTTTSVVIASTASPPPPPPASSGGSNGGDQGTPGNDVLTAASGGDTILALSGNDTLTGGTGHDMLYGNAGDDVITLLQFTDASTVYGGQGNDVIDARNSSAANFLSGDLGNDSIMAGEGSDTLYGGDGDDTLVAGSGHDQIYGNTGNDHIVLGASSGPATVYGGQGDDLIDASASNQSNFISGDLGNDLVQLGSGADTAYGGGGDDTLLAGSGHDQLYGNAGNDVITIGASNLGSTVYGGQGDDVIDASGSNHANFISGDLGNDMILAGSGGDTIHGGAGSDTIQAATGAATFIHVGLTDSSAPSAVDAAQLDHVLNFNGQTRLVFDGDPQATSANTVFHGSDPAIANYAAAYAYAYGSATQTAAIGGPVAYAVVSDIAGHVYVFASDHAAVEIDGLSAGVSGVGVAQISGT